MVRQEPRSEPRSSRPRFRPGRPDTIHPLVLRVTPFLQVRAVVVESACNKQEIVSLLLL